MYINPVFRIFEFINSRISLYSKLLSLIDAIGMNNDSEAASIAGIAHRIKYSSILLILMRVLVIRTAF